MQCADQEFAEVIKRFEEECNKQIYELVNSEAFAELLGKGIEQHVDHILFLRQATEEWLKCSEYATRDDTAAISLKLIECESKLDLLEEDLYHAHCNMTNREEKVQEANLALRNLLSELFNELKAIKNEKRFSLAREMKELKQLF